MKKETEEQIKILNKRIKAAELGLENAQTQLEIQNHRLSITHK